MGLLLRDFRRVDLANFGVLAKTKPIHEKQRQAKVGTSLDAPLKQPPDWRNWLTPIAPLIVSVFTEQP